MVRMRWLRAAPLLALAACTTYGATNSPITDENAIEVPELEGTWVARDVGLEDTATADSGCLTITRVPARLDYRVGFREEGACGAPEHEYEARFAEFDGQIVAAVRPAIDFPDDDLVLSLYQFWRVRVSGDSMGTVALDADTLRARLVENPTAQPHALLEGEGPDVLLLGTPEQLGSFLASHARDPALWEEGEIPLTFERVRPRESDTR